MHIVAKPQLLYVLASKNSYEYKYLLGLIVIEIFNNNLIFKTSTYNYRKTVLSEEHLETLSSLGNYFGLEYLKIRSYIEESLFLLASVTIH